MGHDETFNTQAPESLDDVHSADGGTDRSVEDLHVSESVSEPIPEMTPRDRAMAIFKSRKFNGESLRMGQVLRRVRETLGLEIADVSEVKHSAPVPKIGDIAPPKPKWPLMVATAAVLTLFAGAAIGVTQIVKPAPELAPAPAIVAVNGARHSLFEDTSEAERPLPTNLQLELVAVRQGWLEIRGADGTIFRSRVMAAGENYFPRLDAGWTVSAKDGGAFQWRVGDVVIGPLGPEGAAVFSVSVDQKLAEAAEMAAPTVAANGAGKATR